VKIGFQLPQYGAFAGPDALRRMATAVEKQGFDSVWVGDHIVIPRPFVDRFSRVFYEAFTTLAFCAGFTSRVRLGLSVLLLPYRPPPVLAKTWRAWTRSPADARSPTWRRAGWRNSHPRRALRGAVPPRRARLEAMKRWWREEWVEMLPASHVRPAPRRSGSARGLRRRWATGAGGAGTASVRVGITLENRAGIMNCARS
jgi:hypothetical protein